METVSPAPEHTSPSSGVRWTMAVQYFGIAAAGFYLLGFVIVSAHLGRFAAENRKLFDAQYVPAGVLFAVVVLLYVSFMKLWLFDAENVVGNVLKVGGPSGSSFFWVPIAFLFTSLGLLFGLIFLTLLISSVFMEQPVTQVFGLITVPVSISLALFLQGSFDT